MSPGPRQRSAVRPRLPARWSSPNQQGGTTSPLTINNGNDGCNTMVPLVVFLVPMVNSYCTTGIVHSKPSILGTPMENPIASALMYQAIADLPHDEFTPASDRLGCLVRWPWIFVVFVYHLQ